MVWNTTQSAFYKAIDDFNNRDGRCEDRLPSDSDTACEKCDGKTCEKSPQNSGKLCPQSPQNRRYFPKRQTSPLADIFSDRDKLLIAGLILILSRQNADQKLIMALVFILLT